MMDRYLQKVCEELAAILKRQRGGDQYGFGDDLVMISEKTCQLQKSGPQAFDKAGSDLISSTVRTYLAHSMNGTGMLTEKLQWSSI